MGAGENPRGEVVPAGGSLQAGMWLVEDGLRFVSPIFTWSPALADDDPLIGADELAGVFDDSIVREWQVIFREIDEVERRLVEQRLKWDEFNESIPAPVALPVVRLQPSEVEHNGKVFQVSPDVALAFRAMIEKHPDRVGLAAVIGAHPERKMAKLPAELKAIVNTSGKGSRLVLS